jgi:3-oxoacyl-[acyl-carrier-protein] synthase-3
MMGPGMTPVGIRGTGSHLPPTIVTNEDLERSVSTHAAWIESTLGIRERRIATPDETTSDLAAHAAESCLENAGMDADELDMIVVATATPDRLAPSTACIVQDKIGAANAASFDVSAVCSGFLYALVVGSQFVATGASTNELVIGADTFSRITDWSDRSCVFFGDGAGAALLSPCAEGFGILAHELSADGSGKWNFTVPAGGCELPACAETVTSGKHTWVMNGRAVFDTAAVVLPRAVHAVLKDADVAVKDIDIMLPHQPSVRLLRQIAQDVGIDFSRVVTNMHRYGNTAAASVAIALDETNRAGDLSEGAIVVLAAVGSGWTWGATVLRWTACGSVKHESDGALLTK